MWQNLTQLAETAIRKEYGLDSVSIPWVFPHEVEHGDVSTPLALHLAKKAGKPPREVAEVLLKAFDGAEGVAKAEVAGAGYINLWLKPEAFLQALASTVEACTPTAVRKSEAPVIVEYSQPNIAKPLAIHHIIGTVLGQTLVNLYKHDGANVISWNYIGDWGTQFGKLAVAHEKWGSAKPVKEYTLDELLALYVRFHEEVKNDESLESQGREAFRKLEAGDRVLRAFWQDVVTVTKASLSDIYRRLHVSFDLDLGESFYEDKMEAVLAEGKKKGVFVAGKEGALIVEFPEEKNMPPYLVLKGDGATLYSTRDIAQMRYRTDTYHPKQILILTDIAQKLHFEQLVETCALLKWELPAFENVLFGRMRFADKSMSTRKGNVLKLEEVLDEAVERAAEIIKERGESIQTDDPADLAEMLGQGALVYGILSQNRKMEMVFDWDKMLSFDGNSAPYIQYTHARACSLLRKAELKEAPVPADVSAVALVPTERSLLKVLLQFPAALEEARTAHSPHVLCTHVYQLCQAFNAFYNAENILQAQEPARGFRLYLADRTASVIRTAAALLTLRVPTRM